MQIAIHRIPAKTVYKFRPEVFCARYKNFADHFKRGIGITRPRVKFHHFLRRYVRPGGVKIGKARPGFLQPAEIMQGHRSSKQPPLIRPPFGTEFLEGVKCFQRGL